MLVTYRPSADGNTTSWPDMARSYDSPVAKVVRSGDNLQCETEKQAVNGLHDTGLAQSLVLYIIIVKDQWLSNVRRKKAIVHRSLF